MLGYQKSSARPWPLPTPIDQINVDLTPFIWLGIFTPTKGLSRQVGASERFLVRQYEEDAPTCLLKPLSKQK